MEFSRPCLVDVGDKTLAVVVIEKSSSAIVLQIAVTLQEFGNGTMRLPPPFRVNIENARLLKVVQTLLAHDFLLSKKLAKGGVLQFEISSGSTRDYRANKTLISLDQEAGIAAKPSEKVLPWLLPKAGVHSLYPYQREGVEWLLQSNKRLVADDMGLGKTVQTIFGVRHGFSELLFKNVLILCPKSLGFNWLAEFQKWAPELIVVAVAPPAKTANRIWDKAFQNSHVLIANYEQVRDSKAILKGKEFDVVIADEAHRLRNTSSQVVNGFRYIEHQRLWALTGTPIERDLRDLATLMSLLDRKRFSVADAGNASAALREKAKPYILRRTKSAVMKDLPEVIVRVEPLELLDSQRKSYRQVLSGVACNGEEIKNPLHKLTELRRVCDCDPITGESAKLTRIAEELLLVQSVGEKAIVFSFLLEPLKALHAMTQQKICGILLHGQMDEEERNQVVLRFRQDPSITVLFASSKIASEGLTLVEANHVFFVNRWWNPSSNAQARDRVNRIGQKRCVIVYEYFCVGTVEEMIQRLLKLKNDIYDEVIGKLEEALLGEPEVMSHLGGR